MPGILLAWLLATVLGAADRVWIDRAGGTAFRHPESLMPLGASARLLVDRDGYRRILRVGLPAADDLTWGEHGVRHLSRPLADGPGDLATAVGGLLGGDWTAEGPATADRAVLRGPGGRVVSLRHAGRLSLVGIGDGIDAKTAELIIATFEVLGPGGATAREAACLAMRIILPDGSLAPRAQTARATGWETALEYESRHFQVRGTAPPDELARLGAHLDGLHAALRLWLPLPEEPTRKSQVAVMKTGAEFAAAADGQVPMNTEGHPAIEGLFLPGPGGGTALTFSDPAGRSIGNVRLRAGHEVVHQYLHGHARRRIPRWFDEGCAVLFENGSVQDGGWQLPAQETRLRLLQGAYRQTGTTLTPLRDHLAGGGGTFTTNHYGECYAMLRVLAVPGKPSASAPGITAAWRVMLQSEGSDEALIDALLGAYLARGLAREAALDAWQAEVLRWVRQGPGKERLTIAAP